MCDIVRECRVLNEWWKDDRVDLPRVSSPRNPEQVHQPVRYSNRRMLGYQRVSVSDIVWEYCVILKWQAIVRNLVCIYACQWDLHRLLKP